MSYSRRVNLVVAMMAEARPLIESFQLERIANDSGLRLFARDDVRLAVTGIGRVAAETATKAVLREDDFPGSLWINIGIAGHRYLPLGTSWCATEVRRAVAGRRYTLNPPEGIDGVVRGPVVTVDRPELDYEDEAAYEMEAAGFMKALVGRTSEASVMVLKVISDNRQHAPEKLTAAKIAEMTKSAIPVLERVCISRRTGVGTKDR